MAERLQTRVPVPPTASVSRRRINDVYELPHESGGSPLSEELQRLAVPRTNAGGAAPVDLTAIRVHRDWFAEALTDALHADAVTFGPHVYMSAAAPDVSTPAGRMLLVHEIFHTGNDHAADAADEEAAAERAGAEAGHAEHSSDPPPGTLPTAHRSPGASVPLVAVGRRTKATIARPSSNEAGPDPEPANVVSVGEALVRLVRRLFERDPDDRGGRLTSVLTRLEPRLRADVVEEVADTTGGHARPQLHELARQRPPEDGGRTDDIPPVVENSPSAWETEPETRPGTTPEVSPRSNPKVNPAEPTENATSGEPRRTDEKADTGETSDDAANGKSVASVSGGTPELAEPAEPASETDETPPAQAKLDASATEGPEGGSAATAAAGEPPPAGTDTAAGSGLTAAPEAQPGAGAEAIAVETAGPTVDATQDAAAAPTEAGGGPDAADTAGGLAEDETADADAEGDTSAGSITKAEPEPASDEPQTPAATADDEPPTPKAPAADDAGPQEGQITGIPDSSGSDTAVADAATTEPMAAESEGAGETADGTDAQAPPAESGLADDGGSVGASGTEDGTAASEEASDAPDTASAGDALEPDEVGAAAGIAPLPEAGPLADPPTPTGGGGGGTAIADPPEPVTPDVSAMKPAAALSAVSSLPATKFAASLTAVSATATKEVGVDRAELEANPPSLERPSGVPADRDASLAPAPLPPLPAPAARDPQAPPGGPGAQPPVPGTLAPAGAPVTLRVPDATAGADGQITADGARRIQTAVRELPTTDPALHIDAGPVPELELTGGEDPQRVDDHAANVEQATSESQAEGLAEARTDAGENDVYPHVPPETLKADLAGGPAPTAAAPTAAPEAGSRAGGPGISAGNQAGAPAAGSAVPDAAIDAIAAEKHGGELATSATEQGTALTAARTDHDKGNEEAREDTDRQINEEITENGADQTEDRRGVRADVGRQRKDWVEEQDAVAAKSRNAVSTATRTATDDIRTARSNARTRAGVEIRTGNEQIAKERSKAELEARGQRERAEKETDDGGFFSWVASKVASFVDGIKAAIHKAFELARKAVDLAVSAAQKAAVGLIELGRKAVVGAIGIAGGLLAGAGDIVLAGFPSARKKFRAKIEEKVAGAQKSVNALADKLKAGVAKLLDGLGKLLKGALTLLEKAYTAAVDVVAGAVSSVIKAAKAFVEGFLDFAALVRDIAASPGAWIRNLGAGLMDGVRNHVWPSLLKAVKNWFTQKVEDVVGVGKMILDVLRKGGITFAQIVGMAWTAIKEALPGIVIQLLIEKLVALLIPAAAALSLIVDGLRAAWGAASSILRAFQAFMKFLKAVKGGNSGPQFGELVGAAAVVVIDFLANFVLIRLKGAGQKVGGVLQKMAASIMKALKVVGKAVKTGAKAAVGVVKRGAKAAVGAVKRGAKAVVRTAGKLVPKGVLQAGAKAARAVIRAVRAGAAKVKAGFTKAKEKLFGKKKGNKKKPKKKALSVEQRIEATRAKFTELLSKGTGSLALWGWTRFLARKFKWKQLRTKKRKQGAFELRGDINPQDILLADGAAVMDPQRPFIHVVDRGESLGTGDPAMWNYQESIGNKKQWQKYQSAAGSQLIQPQLKQNFPELSVMATLPDMRNVQTSGKRIVSQIEKRNRLGGGNFGSVVPDVQTIVPGLRTTAEGKTVRDTKNDILYIFEPTLNENFLQGGEHWMINAGKVSQLHDAFTNAFKQYPRIGTIIYTIITPHNASDEVLDYLKLRREKAMAHERAKGKTLHVVWRKVGA